MTTREQAGVVGAQDDEFDADLALSLSNFNAQLSSLLARSTRQAATLNRARQTSQIRNVEAVLEPMLGYLDDLLDCRKALQGK